MQLAVGRDDKPVAQHHLQRNIHLRTSAIQQAGLLTCVLYKRPFVAASQVLYEIVTEG
jgi:hypothetical protein